MGNIRKFSTLQDAIDLATLAHNGQKDQAGMDYIHHPTRVLQAVQAQGAQPYVQMAAILHDVTEDTAFTCQMLLDLGFSEAVVEIVKLVDRDYSAALYRATHDPTPFELDLKDGEELNPGEKLLVAIFGDGEYKQEDIDAFYYANIKANPGALMVKLADIGDNTQPYRLNYLTAARQEKLTIKYKKALDILLG